MLKWFRLWPVELNCPLGLKKSLFRDGPLEITGGGVTIPQKISCKRNLSKRNPASGLIRKKRILTEEATCIALKAIKIRDGGGGGDGNKKQSLTMKRMEILNCASVLLFVCKQVFDISSYNKT